MSADRVNVNPLAKIVRGVTHENVYRRVGWLYVSFALLFVPVTVASHYLLPEGILRGKHPIIRALQFSPNVWLATLQICAYNLIPTALIVGANLLAQRSRFCEESQAGHRQPKVGQSPPDRGGTGAPGPGLPTAVGSGARRISRDHPIGWIGQRGDNDIQA
jgi:hypothetical protein